MRKQVGVRSIAGRVAGYACERFQLGDVMNIADSRILIVDDEPVNRLLLKKALGTLYRVEIATNGGDAVEQIKLHPPDLILLDVMMPVMDGFEVCRLIKAESGLCDIPVIFITSLNQIDEELRGLEMGAVDYIYKPYNINMVQLRVRNQLELKRHRDLIEQQRAELEKTLALLKRLEGIIPICMFCKKIRNDDDYWQQVEQYITEHSEALFSHGICPSCYEKNYGDKKGRKGLDPAVALSYPQLPIVANP
jgi:CheY-like chemotaxis protein